MLSFIDENILGELFSCFEVTKGSKILKEINNSTLRRSLLKTLSFEKIFSSLEDAEVIFEKEEKGIYSIGTLPNNVMILVDGNKLKIFNLIDLQKARTIETKEKINSMLILSNGNILICNGNKLTLWDINSANNITTAYYYKDTPETIKLGNLFQLSNGNIVCSASLEDSDEVLIFNHDLECIKVFKDDEYQFRYAFANLPNNRFCYGSGVHLKIIDVNNGYECSKVLPENREITSLHFIEKNNMLLSGGFNLGCFQIWDANNFKCIKLVRTICKRIYMFLSLPCGYIACGMYDSVFDGSTIEIWDINEGQCINVLKT
jgi:WD40 repeat protein